MNIDFNASPNFAVDRKGNAIEGIVVHVTEGKFTGALDWCQNPKSQVSYHYIIAENGAITQLVEDKDTAWHAGLMKNATDIGQLYGPNPNLKTIGIAYAGFAEQGPNFEQMTALCDLVRHLSDIHSIPLDRKNILAHHDIRTDKVCPGPHVNFDAILYMCSLT